MMTNLEFRKGQRHFLRGEYGKSIKDFNIALEQGVEGAIIYIPLGLARMKNGEFSEAVREFSFAIELDPKNDYAFFLRGIAYFNLNDLNNAVSDLDHSISLNGHRGAAFVARSLAMKMMERPVEAEEDMRRALSLADVEVEYFIREYCIAANMYRSAMSLFDLEKERWTDELRKFRREQTH